MARRRSAPKLAILLIAGVASTATLAETAVGQVQVPGGGSLPATPDLPSAPDLPSVPQVPAAPDLPAAPAVDDVADELPSTAVDEVLPGDGGGAPETAADPPAQPEPPAQPAPPAPTSPATSGTPVVGGDGAPSGTNGDEPGGERRSAGEDSSAAGPGSGGGSSGAQERAGQGDAAPDRADANATDDSGLSARVGDLIAALPAGILIGLIALSAIALLMTGRSAWFARATRRLKIQRRALRSDVGVLQSALVPDLPAAIAGVGVAVAYRPAVGPAAGGDFHDVFELEDGRLGVVAGDVAGHGREALPRTGIVRFTIRAYLEAGLEPRVAIRLADRALQSTFDDDVFATAIAATYDPSTRRLTYACAGHPQPIVLGPDPPRAVEIMSSPPIGLGSTSGTRQTTLTLTPGSEVWVFSDGLTESSGRDGMLGRSGLTELLAGQPDPEELLDDLAADAHDDLTVVRLRPPDAGHDAEHFGVEALLLLDADDDREVPSFLQACGLASEEIDEVCDLVRSERCLEGLVLIRISKLDSVTHWRVERVDPDLGQPVPPVEGVPAPAISG